jgi:hypothetical protein
MSVEMLFGMLCPGGKAMHCFSSSSECDLKYSDVRIIDLCFSWSRLGERQSDREWIDHLNEPASSVER